MLNVVAAHAPGSSIESLLLDDPAGIYPRQTSATQADYRAALARLSGRWRVSEAAICEAAIALARRAPRGPGGAAPRSHVGYYLVDDGVAALRAALGVSSSFPRLAPERIRIVRLIAAQVALTLLFAAALYAAFAPPASWPIAAHAALAVVLLLVTAQPAWDVLFEAMLHVLRPTRLPRVDLSSGITPANTTVVVVPVLLLDAAQVKDLAATLKEHSDVAADPDALFALVTNFADSETSAVTSEQRLLLEAAARAVEDLNAAAGTARTRPFLLLHRDRVWCATEQRWIGRERKRGKVDDLLTYMITGRRVFSRVVGDVDRLRRARYLLVLDEDTHLTTGALQALVGTASHPLNEPVVDEERRVITRGYGIFTPDVIEPRSPLAADQPSRDGARNPMQDATGRDGYGGKGVIHAGAYYRVLTGTLPEGRVLNQDTVECIFVRAAAVPGVLFWEPRPTSFEAACRRRHRWLRGIWQNAFLLWRRDPPAISLFGRWQLVSRSVNCCFPMAASLALVAGALVNPPALLLAIPLVGGPAIVSIAGRVAAAARQGRFRESLHVARSIVLLPVMVVMAVPDVAHNAVLAADALVRTVARMATGRRLLQWESFAQTRRADGRSPAATLYRRYWTLEAAGGVCALGAVLWLMPPHWTLAALLAVWTVRPVMYLRR